MPPSTPVVSCPSSVAVAGLASFECHDDPPQGSDVREAHNGQRRVSEPLSSMSNPASPPERQWNENCPHKRNTDEREQLVRWIRLSAADPVRIEGPKTEDS